MKIPKPLLSLELAAALLTWLLVSTGSLRLLSRNEISSSLMLLVVALLLMFIVLALSLPDHLDKHASKKRVATLFLLAYSCLLGLFVLVPYSLVTILLIILAPQLAFFVSIRAALLVSLLAMLPMWLLYQFYWQHNSAWLSAMLYWSFCLFAIVMVDAIRRETASRQLAEQTNRELKATQQLLNDASRHNERNRIAQQLHDVLGHHLTALTIHLQVAARQSSEQQKPQLEQCHQLARLLLADVRQTVYDIKDSPGININQAIGQLITGLPRLQVELHSELNRGIKNVGQADALLRVIQEAISNSLRHSMADKMQIRLSESNQQLQLQITDNGAAAASTAKEGLGLSGMRERITELGGTFAYQPATAASGFGISISLPEPD